MNKSQEGNKLARSSYQLLNAKKNYRGTGIGSNHISVNIPMLNSATVFAKSVLKNIILKWIFMVMMKVEDDYPMVEIPGVTGLMHTASILEHGECYR